MIVPDWPRPHYEPSPQGPELFYLVVGEQPEGSTLQLSRARHHVDRIEDAIQISKHSRRDDPAWFDAWFSGTLGGYLDEAFREDSEPVRRCHQLTVVRGSFPDQPSLAYLRNTVGVVSAVAEAGALAVFDVYAFTWWRPDEWRRRFVDRSEFRIDDHIFIPVTDEPRHRPGLWSHTRGMRKFGRPDISVRRVGAAHAEGVYELCDRFIEYMAFGGLPPAGQEIRMGDLPAGGVVRHGGSPDDPDFNNVHIEVIWPGDELAGGED